MAKVLWTKDGFHHGWARRFSYGPEGTLQLVIDSERGPTRYEHDAALRLAKTIHPDGRVDEYKYNAAGTLYQAPTLGHATVGAGNRLRYANGEQYEYDQRHHLSRRVTTGGTIQYDYDSNDQLAVVFWQGPDGQTWGWDADYDALGRRIRKAPAYTNDTRYYWDTDRLAAEVFCDGRLRIYVYPDAVSMVPMLFVDYASVDAELSSGQRYCVLTDQRGCVTRVIDGRGTTVWFASIDPYGAARVDVGADFHQPLRFPGHWFDPETGLHYNRFRYLDPALGRYLQSDPAGLWGGVNLYAYTDNPLVSVDVRGLSHDPRPVARTDEGEPPPATEGPAQPGVRHPGEAPPPRVGDEALGARYGLTARQREWFRQRMGEARRSGDVDGLRRLRYERTQTRRRNRGAAEYESIDHWSGIVDRRNVSGNQDAGSAAEEAARPGVGEYAGRELASGNSRPDGQGGTTKYQPSVEMPDGSVVETRPDGITLGPDGAPDPSGIVQDHKHFMEGNSDQEYADDAQLQAQRRLAEQHGGRHIVSMTSDAPDLDGVPPRPRPDPALGASSSEIVYVDPGTHQVTRVWNSDTNSWDPV